jgi:hypothetical protein
MSQIIIDSENAFLDLLGRLSEESIDVFTDVKFEGWPTLRFNFKGQRYNSSLPSNAMSGILSLQEAFSRAYAIAKYDTTNLQKLTDTEKKDLEFIFEISAGSTQNTAASDDWLNRAFDNLGNVMANMESKHKTAVFITLILCAGGYFAFSEYLQTKQKEAELEGNSRLVVSVLEQHNKTISELISPEANRHIGKKTEWIKSTMSEGQASLVRSVSDADQVTYGNVVLDKVDIKEISKSEKPVKDKQELISEFSMDGLKKYPEYLLFNVTDLRSGQSFSLKVDLGFTKQVELDSMYAALKDSTSVTLEIDAVIKAGAIEKGRLISVINNK